MEIQFLVLDLRHDDSSFTSQVDLNTFSAINQNMSTKSHQLPSRAQMSERVSRSAAKSSNPPASVEDPESNVKRSETKSLIYFLIEYK